MNDRTIVQHPNGYSGVLMGKSTMMIYDKDDNCVLHTCFRTPNTEKELYEVLETMPRFIEILASVEADRKTENSSEKPNNCEHITEDGVTCAKYPACDYCLDNPLNKVKGSERLLKGKTEPTISKMEQVEDEPQTDCAWMKGE